MELKEVLIVETHSKCHCSCSSETETCIISDAGRQFKLHTKNNENTRFVIESRQTTFYTHVWRYMYILIFNAKKTFKKMTKLFFYFLCVESQYILSRLHDVWFRCVRSFGVDLVEWSLVWSGAFVKAVPKLELVVAWRDYRSLCMIRYGAWLSCW
jgi:hypothetical protein